MSVVITKEDLIAYAEVDYVINHMNEKYVAMLPQNLLTFFSTMKDPDYQVYIDPHKPLQNQGLQKYALEIIALLHIKYWCQNKERKEELLEKMRKNQEKFEMQLREKFSTDKLFENSQKVSNDDPIVTAFSKYAEKNPDIHDYTDVRENEVKTADFPEKLPNKTSVLGKIKMFVSKMFRKNAG